MNLTSDSTGEAMLFARHIELSRTWCAIRNVDDGNYATYCSGRFNVGDAAQFDICANPSSVCAACRRVLDAERGLAVQPLFEAEMVDDRFNDDE